MLETYQIAIIVILVVLIAFMIMRGSENGAVENLEPVRKAKNVLYGVPVTERKSRDWNPDY